MNKWINMQNTIIFVYQSCGTCTCGASIQSMFSRSEHLQSKCTQMSMVLESIVYLFIYNIILIIVYFIL